MRDPLRTTILFFSFAFGITGMGVGINAAVKQGDTKDYIRNNAPSGVTVHIDTSEAFDPGAVLTVGCGLLALTSLFTFLLQFFRPRAWKAYRGAAFLHFFWAVWIFATLVAYDVIARNRSVKVEAFLGDTQLPDSIVRQQEQALGVSREYWDYDYICYLAIIPWAAFLFAIVAGLVLLRPVPPKDKISTATTDAAGLGIETEEKEKPGTEKRELVAEGP